MSKRDPKITLCQILVHAYDPVSVTHGKSRADLDQGWLLNLALTRLLEIIGEAANYVPDEIQAQVPDLEQISN